MQLRDRVLSAVMPLAGRRWWEIRPADRCERCHGLGAIALRNGRCPDCGGTGRR